MVPSQIRDCLSGLIRTYSLDGAAGIMRKPYKTQISDERCPKSLTLNYICEAPNCVLGPMSKRAAVLLIASGTLAFWPPDAHAHKIPWIVLPLAASPFVAVLLSAALGIVTKSWAVGLGNTVLVITWVVWFAAASNYSTSDLLIWASIVALGLHALLMLWFIALHAFRRRRMRNEA